MNYIDDQEQRAIEAASKGDVTISGSIAREALRRGLLSEAMADKLSAHRKSVSERIEKAKRERGAGEETEGTNTTSLEKMLESGSSCFGDYLVEMIKEKGLTNSQVYKAALVSKQTFSNIRNSQNQPKRETVAAFAVGMKLTVPEAEKLYEAAGYVLTETNKFDLCVRYFLNARKYNVVEDNIILDEYGLPLMGARA